MSTRMRSLLIVFLAVVALLAAGIYFLASNLDGIVAGVIEDQGSRATGTDVNVEGVDIQLSEATAALSGLAVANPEGFPGNALTLGGFSLQLDPGSLRTDTIVIRSIAVDGATINLMQQGTRNNLKRLLDNLKAMQSDPAQPDSDAGSRRLIIERFTLSDAEASVSVPDLGQERTVALPPIVVRDIGKASGGATGSQIAEQLLTPIIEAAMKSAAAQSIKDKARKELGEAMGGFLKGMTEGNGE